MRHLLHITWRNYFEILLCLPRPLSWAFAILNISNKLVSLINSQLQPRLVSLCYCFLCKTNVSFKVSSFDTIEMAINNRRFYAKSFFYRTSRLQNSLPASRFPVKLDLQRFRCDINRYLLSSGLLFYRSHASIMLLLFFLLLHPVTLCVLVALMPYMERIRLQDPQN